MISVSHCFICRESFQNMCLLVRTMFRVDYPQSNHAFLSSLIFMLHIYSARLLCNSYSPTHLMYCVSEFWILQYAISTQVQPLYPTHKCLTNTVAKVESTSNEGLCTYKQLERWSHLQIVFIFTVKQCHKRPWLQKRSF